MANLIQKIWERLSVATLLSFLWAGLFMFAALSAEAAVIGPDKLSSNPNESDGAVTIDLNADTAVSRDTLINYTITGTSDNLDHDVADGSIWMLNGTNTVQVSFNLLDDSNYEGDETLVLTITSVGTGSTVSGMNTHTMTIADDESIPSLSLTTRCCRVKWVNPNAGDHCHSICLRHNL